MGALDLGVDVVRALQERAPWLLGVMHLLTLLGDEEFYVAAFPALYWSVSRRLGLRLGVVLLVSAGLNAAAKLAFAAPRPFFLEPDLGLVEETSFGVPSGHAQNAVALWGLVAAWVRRRGVWLLAGALVAGISLSRVALGVHFVQDVLLGWALGGALLAAFVVLEPSVSGWLARRGALARVGSALGASVVLVAAGAGARVARTGWQPPAGWDMDGGAELLTLAAVVTAAGALFGLGAGATLVGARGGFALAEAWWQRALCYPIGMVGVALLYVGLGALLPGGDEPAALALRYVRFALIGLWVGGVAPLVFVRLGIAARARVAAGAGA